MLPEITDALIAEAIQTPRMVEAGRDYWGRGRVRELSVAPERDQVRAVVAGSGEHPYEVELYFSGAPPEVLAECSCPVGLGCKHAAAALFALREREKLRPAQGPARRRPSPPPVLPPALSQWLAAMRPLMRETDRDAEPGPRAAYYVVRAQAPTGPARMSAKRSAASLAEPGRPLRLFAEVQDIALDGEGRPAGGARTIPYYQAVQASPEAVHLTHEDRLIIRRLNARVGETDHEGCLAGVGGFDLLTRMVATGRRDGATRAVPRFGWSRLRRRRSAGATTRSATPRCPWPPCPR